MILTLKLINALFKDLTSISSPGRVIMKLAYTVWRVETVNIQIGGENLICGHYSRTAPLNVYYRSQDHCICKYGDCGSIYLILNNPGDEIFCDAHFVGQY